MGNLYGWSSTDQCTLCRKYACKVLLHMAHSLVPSISSMSFLQECRNSLGLSLIALASFQPSSSECELATDSVIQISGRCSFFRNPTVIADDPDLPSGLSLMQEEANSLGFLILSLEVERPDEGSTSLPHDYF
jgi:hypothetical protein